MEDESPTLKSVTSAIHLSVLMFLFASFFKGLFSSNATILLFWLYFPLLFYFMVVSQRLKNNNNLTLTVCSLIAKWNMRIQFITEKHWHGQHKHLFPVRLEFSFRCIYFLIKIIKKAKNNISGNMTYIRFIGKSSFSIFLIN